MTDRFAQHGDVGVAKAVNRLLSVADDEDRRLQRTRMGDAGTFAPRGDEQRDQLPLGPARVLEFVDEDMVIPRPPADSGSGQTPPSGAGAQRLAAARRRSRAPRVRRACRRYSVSAMREHPPHAARDEHVQVATEVRPEPAAARQRGRRRGRDARSQCAADANRAFGIVHATAVAYRPASGNTPRAAANVAGHRRGIGRRPDVDVLAERLQLASQQRRTRARAVRYRRTRSNPPGMRRNIAVSAAAPRAAADVTVSSDGARPRKRSRTAVRHEASIQQGGQTGSRAALTELGEHERDVLVLPGEPSGRCAARDRAILR